MHQPDFCLRSPAQESRMTGETIWDMTKTQNGLENGLTNGLAYTGLGADFYSIVYCIPSHLQTLGTLKAEHKSLNVVKKHF